MTAPRHDTWMPLYVADYLKDTRHLSGTEHGAYLLLLMHAWTNEGMIPREDSRLARIACLTPAEWKRAKKAVLSFWIDLGDASEIYMNKRINDEMERARQITEKRSKAGARGAAGRWQTHPDANGKRMANVCDDGWQNDGPSQSHTLSTKEHNARQARLPDALVNQIWESAPAKARERSSKADVRRTLTAAIKRGADPATVAASLLAYYRSDDASKDDGAFAKGIHRMIEGDRWKGWSPAATPAKTETPVDWPARLEGWVRERFWIPTMWGPDPSCELCRAPAELLTPEVRRPRMGAR